MQRSMHSCLPNEHGHIIKLDLKVALCAAAIGVHGSARHPDRGYLCCVQSMVELLPCAYHLFAGHP